MKTRRIMRTAAAAVHPLYLIGDFDGAMLARRIEKRAMRKLLAERDESMPNRCMTAPAQSSGVEWFGA